MARYEIREASSLSSSSSCYCRLQITELHYNTALRRRARRLPRHLGLRQLPLERRDLGLDQRLCLSRLALSLQQLAADQCFELICVALELCRLLLGLLQRRAQITHTLGD